MKGIKAFQIRLPKEIWAFLKKKSVDRELSMNQMIIECLTKYKNKSENKLTSNDSMVS